MPSSGSSSNIAFKIVRYKLQTFILVLRDAVAIGAKPPDGPFSSAAGRVMTGKSVDNDSGSLRVRKRVEACRYIFVICEAACREEVELEREEIDEPSNWEEDSTLGVFNVAVAVAEPFVSIALAVLWLFR